jgi:hypothetical protein
MRRMLRRAVMTAAAIPALLALAVYLPASAMAAPPVTGAHEVSQLVVQLPLSGTIQGPTELIGINGTLKVHVVSYTGTPSGDLSARVDASLASTTGTGQTTGDTYRLLGTVTFPPQRVSSGGGALTFNPAFTLVPPSPAGDTPGPIQFVQLTVPIAADGTIGDITATLLTPAS